MTVIVDSYMYIVHLVALLFYNYAIFLFSRLNLFKWDVTHQSKESAII